MGSHQRAHFRGLIKEQTPLKSRVNKALGGIVAHTLTGVIWLFHQPTFGVCPGPTQRLEGLRSRCFHTSTCSEVSIVSRYIVLVPVVFHSVSLTPRWAEAAQQHLHHSLTDTPFFLRLFVWHHFSIAVEIYVLKCVCVCMFELRQNALSSLIYWNWFSQIYTTYTTISYEVRGNILLILFSCLMHTLLYKIYIPFTL